MELTLGQASLNFCGDTKQRLIYDDNLSEISYELPVVGTNIIPLNVLIGDHDLQIGTYGFEYVRSRAILLNCLIMFSYQCFMNNRSAMFNFAWDVQPTRNYAFFDENCRIVIMRRSRTVWLPKSLKTSPFRSIPSDRWRKSMRF